VAGPPRLRRTAGAATLALVGVPSPASAHGSTQVGDFYGGLLQPLYHPESLLLLLALGLWAGQVPPARQWVPPLAFAGATLLGAGLGLAGLSPAPALWLVRGGALGLGLMVAARWVPPALPAVGLALVLGLGQGQYASFSERQEVERVLLYVLGAGLAPLLVCGWLVTLAERARAFWAQIALRVAGSWIATIALLVSALELAGARG